MTAPVFTASLGAPASITPLEFLTALYGRAAAQGFIEFRFLRSGRQVFMPWPIFEKHPDLFTLGQVPQGQQAYFGIAIRKQSGTGGKANCKPTPLQWADFDLKGTLYVHGQMNLLDMAPDELRAAAQVLWKDVQVKSEALGFPVRLAVYTGHGLQVYWARRMATTAEENERYNRALVAEYGEAFGADWKAVDLSRIFRLPGSHNLKNPQRPLPVEVWHVDTDALIPNDAALGRRS